MISSIFSRLKQQVTGAGDSGSYSQSHPDRSDYSGLDPHSAPEEDGFLVVGETASERTTVRASSFDVHGQYAPPSYDQVAVNNKSSPDASTQGFSMFATCAPTPSAEQASASSASGDGHSSGHHPAIKGVPFQLNPRLQDKERLMSLFSDLNLQCARFDWQKYEYDFDFERESLKELCAASGEEDMDTSTFSMSAWAR
ncbi:hypothetical protein BaRGS_00008030 [Batillaria attramentaria]|uniref:UMA domain-containing protein n=1 Tax=Batillaria attramentaria TaxID=370345 RepID=A0ABD0LMU7_9CAEN